MFLPSAITNLVQALLLAGDLDAAEHELSQAINSDGLADIDLLPCYRAWLAALRGDSAAQTMLAGLRGLRASEDSQDIAIISVVEAFTALARQQPQQVLRDARATLADAETVGISYEYQRWAWPLAARAAFDLDDTAATGELLAMLGSYQPGQLAPMLQAERDLVRARLAARDNDQAAASLAAAISGLREHSTPYHLVHGLLAQAGYLTRLGDAAGAEAAISKACDIAHRLRCQPLLDRAADLRSARPPVQA